MNESKPDINKVLFMHLVSMLAMSAIQQMGKLVDPGTGKAEINLEAAQATIDMLDMLELKTRGNLDAEETRLIKDTLMSLKMNYVESQEQKTEVRGQKSEVSLPCEAPAKQGDQQADGGGGSQKSEVRSQKSSGSGEEKQTSHNVAQDAENQKKVDGKSASAGEDKTPKYHKKYE